MGFSQVYVVNEPIVYVKHVFGETTATFYTLSAMSGCRYLCGEVRGG